MAEAGARLAIRLLQDAAERGDIDPWDVDVIAVVDGFLDQLRQRIVVPRLIASCGGSYEQDLSETSEAFLAASVLVGLKAEVLEASTFPPQPVQEFELEFAEADEAWADGAPPLPLRPERHLRRRPVAPPPLQRPITLGELISQLEEIATQLEQDQSRGPRASRGRRYSDRAAIAQVAALAHREKLPETTAALSRFLAGGLQGGTEAEDPHWQGFEELVANWADYVRSCAAEEELDADRVGVFWALLFLCSQGKVELDQQGGLFAPLRLRCLPNDDEQKGPVQLRLPSGSAATPAGDVLAA